MGSLMSTVKANDLQTTTGGIPTVKGQKLIPTAWVNFNGTGTVAIRDSENVSSISDNSTGDYSVNFISNLANTNYCVLGANTSAESNGSSCMPSNYSTTNIRVNSRNGSGGLMDGSKLNVTVLGGQA